MADFLSPAPEPGNTRKLLLIGLAVALAIAAAFGIFYHHENHAPLQATATRVLTLPLHSVYGHVKDAAGADETEDSVYIVPLLRIQNQGDVPLFLKDITGSVTLEDGRENPGRLIGKRDRDRLQQLVPGIAPLLRQANSPALDPEQQVAPHATAQGYAIFLYTMPSTEWDKRQSASVRLDFYHQDAVTIPLPK